MFDISIVIRCYNEVQHIEKLLQGIAQQNLKNIEIIVVDSGSDDGTLDVVQKYPIRLITINPNDFSFGRSLNLGCDAANGEFIVIVSAHVYPIYQDWLQKLIEPFENKKIALAYGKQRGAKTTQYSEKQIFETWFPDTPRVVNSEDYPFCNNANSAIRKTLWEEYHYDETLTGLEDLAWAKKVIDAGYQIAYVPEAEIIHIHNETPARTYNRYRREAIAFKSIYSQENFSFGDFIRLLLANVFSDYYHALKDGVFAKEFRAILIFRFMQFWGTFHGYCHRKSISNELRQTFYYPRSLTSTEKKSNTCSSQTIDYTSI